MAWVQLRGGKRRGVKAIIWGLCLQRGTLLIRTPNPHLTGSSTRQFTWLSHTPGLGHGAPPMVTLQLGVYVWGLLNGKSDAPSFHSYKSSHTSERPLKKGTCHNDWSLTTSQDISFDLNGAAIT